jgi:hypothetical protein
MSNFSNEVEEILIVLANALIRQAKASQEEDTDQVQHITRTDTNRCLGDLLTHVEEYLIRQIKNSPEYLKIGLP